MQALSYCKDIHDHKFLYSYAGRHEGQGQNELSDNIVTNIVDKQMLAREDTEAY